MGVVRHGEGGYKWTKTARQQHRFQLLFALIAAFPLACEGFCLNPSVNLQKSFPTDSFAKSSRTRVLPSFGTLRCSSPQSSFVMSVDNEPEERQQETDGIESELGIPLGDLRASVENVIGAADELLRELSSSSQFDDEDDEPQELHIESAEEFGDPYTAMMKDVGDLAKQGLAGKTQAKQVLADMEKLGIVPNEDTYMAYMNVLIKAAKHRMGGPGDGAEVMRLMEQRGLTPPDSLYTLLVTYLSRIAPFRPSVTFEDGLEVLALMRERGVQPSLFLYSSLVSLAAKTATEPPLPATRFLQGLGVIEGMRKAGVTPDVVCYNALLVAAVKCPNTTLDDGYWILDEMGHVPVRPDEFTFATLLDLCASDVGRGLAEVSDAEQVMVEMTALGLKTSTYVYNSLLKAYAKAAARGRAGIADMRGVISRMEQDKVRLDRITFTTWISALPHCAERAMASRSDARVAIVRMREEGMSPSAGLYHVWLRVIAIEAAQGLAGPDDALDVVDFMRRVGKRVGTETYMRVMHVMVEAGRVRGGRGGLFKQAQSVLREVQRSGLPLSPALLTYYIQVARMDGSGKAVGAAWREFVGAEGSLRNEFVYSAMMTTLLHAGQKHTAASLLGMARDQGLALNSYIYNGAMQALGEPARILELYEQMKADGVSGDAVTRKYVRLARKGLSPPHRSTPRQTHPKQ